MEKILRLLSLILILKTLALLNLVMVFFALSEKIADVDFLLIHLRFNYFYLIFKKSSLHQKLFYSMKRIFLTSVPKISIPSAVVYYVTVLFNFNSKHF
jgi:hypothetical protein